jgi:hypothetical protein
MWTKLAVLGVLALRAAVHSQAPFSSARAYAYATHLSTPQFDAAALGDAFTQFDPGALGDTYTAFAASPFDAL